MHEFLLKVGLLKLINKSKHSLASIDSRTIRVGQIFFALPGENFDGHEFVQVAAAKGAIAAVVTEPVDSCIIPQLVVSDVRKCLIEFAMNWRQAMSPICFAITGSNGKTTTRAMVQHVLEKLNKNVCASTGNHNNELGLALSLLKLKNDHEYAVFELGASGPNEISELAKSTAPNIAAITNVSECHLSGFKSLDGVVKAKSELFSAMSTGKAIINVDSYGSRYFHTESEHLKIISLGKNATGLDYSISEIIQHTDNSVSFELNNNNMITEVSLQVSGEHNVYNACTAIAMLVEAGLDIREVVKALASFTGVAKRLTSIVSSQGFFIIDDTYNASPASFAAATAHIAAHSSARKWVACADMAELGDKSEQWHEQVLNNLVSKGINVIAIGTEMHKAFDKLSVSGFKAKSIDDANEIISKQLKSGDVLLVKGSRCMQMDLLVEMLAQVQYA